MVYLERMKDGTTRLTGAAKMNQDTQSPYWEGSAVAEPASVTNGWTSHTRVPTGTSVFDLRSVFTPIAGGIQINFPGTYEIEISGTIAGGAVGAREGITMFTTGGIAPLIAAGGSVVAGNLTYVSAIGSSRHYSAKMIVTVTAAGAAVKFQDYVQTATSHTATLTRIRATKIVQGAPGPEGSQGDQGDQGDIGPTGTRWGYTSTWAFADATDVSATMFDGGLPRVGDLLMSLNGFSNGDVYQISAVYPSGNVDVIGYTPAMNLQGPKGTRWGTTASRIVGGAGTELAGVACTFPDGGLPRAGDIVQSTHIDAIGDVYYIKETVYGENSATIKQFSPPMNIRGATGPAGSALSHWPIDSVYISYSPTNPTILFGGTWTAVGTGRMLIGVDPADTAMDAPGDTGGNKTTTLSTGNLPTHTHGAGTLVNATNGNHLHNITRKLDVGSGTGVRRGATASTTEDAQTDSAGDHSHNITGDTGVGNGLNANPFSNLPPYLAVYMWRRTA